MLGKNCVLKEPEKFYSWLVSLSRNLLLDQLREIKRYTEIVNLFGESEMQRSTHQQVDSIQDALANVPQDDREIMALKIFLEYSFVEIGDLLSITESAAKMRYYRAVEKLKNETN